MAARPCFRECSAPRALDILVTVENSGSLMLVHRRWFRALPAVLAPLVATGAPVRIGVVSADLGVGSDDSGWTYCDESGEVPPATS